MDELVSIIIPVYNAELYIEECLDSLINQSYKNIEIIVVNDGSEDKSKNIIENKRNIDSRIKLINKNNTGVSDTRNIALNAAKGKYVAFCDADDVVHKKCIETLVDIIRYNKSDMAIIDFTRDYACFGESDYEIKALNKNEACCLILNENGYLWNKLFKRDIIINNNITFDMEISVCEDQLFIVEYIKYINKINLNKSKMYFYRNVDNSALNSKKLTVKKMSEIKAREKTLHIVDDEKFESICINLAAIKLISSYCYFNKDLFLKNNDRDLRKTWLHYIINNFYDVKNIYGIRCGDLPGLKLKVYYITLLLVSYFIHIKKQWRSIRCKKFGA